jgi:HSP20 family protein
MNSENTNAKTAAETPAELTRSGRCYRPNVDIIEHDDELLVLADVPGANSNSIDVKFEDGTLEIYASVAPRQSAEQDYLLREYGLGDYYRTFHLSESIDAAKITARCADGVLELRLPKSEAVKPRKISVAGA